MALPGQMGNVILHPWEIADAEEETRQAYSGTAPAALLQAAKLYCDHSVGDDVLREIIDFLPGNLARARQAGHGLLTLARAQI
jgi:hypothetical protein